MRPSNALSGTLRRGSKASLHIGSMPTGSGLDSSAENICFRVLPRILRTFSGLLVHDSARASPGGILAILSSDRTLFLESTDLMRRPGEL